VELVESDISCPGPRLAKSNFALHAILGPRRDFARQSASDRIWRGILAIIIDQRESSVTQLIKIPEIAGAAVLPQLDDEKIIAATLDEGTFIVLGEKPNISAPIRGFITVEQLLFNRFRLDIDQLLALPASNNLVPLERKAGRSVAGAKAKRSLVQEGGVSKLAG
jgi:hypothetical protein